MIDHDGVIAKLDAVLEGGLPDEERREVEAHLASCLACAREMAALADLVARARSLPESVPPARDLWPEIRTRVTPPPSRRPVAADDPRPRRRWFAPSWVPAIAATAAVAAITAAVLFLPSRPGEKAPGPPRSVPGSSPNVVVVGRDGTPQSPGVARLIWGLEQESSGMGESVLADLDRNPGALGSRGVEQIRAGLASLDRAIDDAVTALRTDPDDPVLIQRVTDYYRRRIALLEGAARAASISA